MSTKKTTERFTQDETLLLLAGIGLCAAKAFIEAEAPLVGVAGKIAGKELLKLGTATALNFNALVQTAEENGTLPRLRGAISKAKEKVKAKL